MAGIGETDGAIEIAPIRHFEQDRTGMLFVGFTESAVERAALFNSPIAEVRMGRRFRSPPFGHRRLPAPYDGPEGTVVPALLDQKDLIALKQTYRFDPLEANRAEAFSFI
jgi:hypothetical protein